MAYILGKEAKLYYSTTALTTTPVEADIDAATGPVNNVMDLSLDLESTFVDITTRGDAAQGFRSQAAVLKNGVISFDVQWDVDGGAFFDALIAAWTDPNTNPIALFAIDQARDASGKAPQGLCGNFSISLTKEEPLNDIQKASVTATVASHPAWVKMSTQP